MSDALPEGLYEALVTDSLRDRLATHPDLKPEFYALDPADSPDVLARHVNQVVRTRLANAKPVDRVAIVNDLLHHLDATDATVTGIGEQLLSLRGAGLDTNPLPRPATRSGSVSGQRRYS